MVVVRFVAKGRGVCKRGVAFVSVPFGSYESSSQLRCSSPSSLFLPNDFDRKALSCHHYNSVSRIVLSQPISDMTVDR